MNVGIVCPGYPDTPGGVTDHTARLVGHWTQPDRGVLVQGTTVRRPETIVADWARAGVGAILIQYVPFLYGRSGLSTFPGRVARAARVAGLRTTVFVHEPWVPPTRVPWLVLSPLQRRQLGRLLCVCDVVVTPVPAWRALLGSGVTVLYVGSNLGDPPARADAPLSSPVVFSPFAAGLNWGWIVAAARAIDAVPQLTVVGGNWETAKHDPILKRWADRSWDWRGRLDPPDVLAVLSRARIVLAPFSDGLTGRRGSALAAMSTGAQLVSSRGPQFDPFFETGLIALADSESEFCELARVLFGAQDQLAQRQRRIEWYRQHLSPVDLDRALLGLVTGARL